MPDGRGRRGLRRAAPGLPDRAAARDVPNALPRQANAYFSSSDADVPDREAASRDFERIRSGEIGVKGGWRVYSSGPGIFLNQLVSNVLGLRRRFDERVFDPILPARADGLTYAARGGRPPGALPVHGRCRRLDAARDPGQRARVGEPPRHRQPVPAGRPGRGRGHVPRRPGPRPTTRSRSSPRSGFLAGDRVCPRPRTRSMRSAARTVPDVDLIRADMAARRAASPSSASSSSMASVSSSSRKP